MLAPTPVMAFSMVEALYARGFRSAADIVELDGAHFQDALVGTVAYDIAPLIYTAAGNRRAGTESGARRIQPRQP